MSLEIWEEEQAQYPIQAITYNKETRQTMISLRPGADKSKFCETLVAYEFDFQRSGSDFLLPAEHDLRNIAAFLQEQDYISWSLIQKMRQDFGRKKPDSPGGSGPSPG